MIRWTARASADAVGIAEWIAEHDPSAAERVLDRILAHIERLATHPFIGRSGRVADTRELVVPRLPYVVVYRVTADSVVVLRILHAAQHWP